MRKSNPQTSLRNRLKNIEEELKLIKDPESKRYKKLIQEHREIVKYFDDEPGQINSLEDIKEYNARSQSKPIRPEV